MLWTGCGGASQRLFLRPRGHRGTYRPLAPGSAGPFTLTAHDMGLPDDRAEVGVNGGRSSQSGGGGSQQKGRAAWGDGRARPLGGLRPPA